MASRDSQTVILSRQAILVVTAVGVGLLTLCYVLGVQVGKQSAALRQPAAHGAGEELQELPASVAEQLKAFERGGAGAGFEQAPKAGAAKPLAAAPAPSPTPAPAKGEAGHAEPAPPKPATERPQAGGPPRWTLQLISTPDPAEAQRMAAKARASGFPTATVLDKGLHKVRLIQPGTREAADATAQKLKNRGFKPFAIKVDEP